MTSRPGDVPRGFPLAALLGGAAALLGGAAALIRLGDPDLWWHLATGRLILAGQWPATNTFSHTFPDHPFANPFWLFQAVAALVERVGGLAAVGLIPVVAIAAACAVAAASAHRISGRLSPVAVLGLLAIALSASRFRFVPRAEIATLLGVVLVVGIWILRPRGSLAWLAFLGCLWANAHPGVLFGLAGLACLALADGWIDKARSRSEGVTAVLVFFGGSLVNPLGIYPYRYALVHTGATRIYHVAEYDSPTWPLDATFFVGAAAVAALALSSLRGRRRRLPILAVLFGVPALLYLRMISVFFLVVLPDAMAELSRLAKALEARRAVVARIAVAALLAAAALLAVRDYRLNAPPYEFGWGVERDWVPEGAARFVRDHALRGRMYNDYDHGGYFAWSLFPDYRTFIDGRMPAYPASFYREFAALSTEEDWSPFLDRFGVDFAVAQRSPYSGEDLGPVFEALGWPLVYMDGVSLIYLRKGGADAARLERERFVTLRSGDGPEEIVHKAKREPRALLHDIRLVAVERLIEPADFLRLAAGAAAARDAALAGRIIAVGLAKHPGDPDLTRLSNFLR